jgi:hypothetical protein
MELPRVYAVKRGMMSNQEKIVTTGEKGLLSPPALTADGRDKREEVVHSELARRLKGICGNLESADFEALLVQMTTEQLRGERYRGS